MPGIPLVAMWKSTRGNNPRAGQASALSGTSQIRALGKQQSFLGNRPGRQTRPSFLAAGTLPISSLWEFLLVLLCSPGSAGSDALLDISPRPLSAAWALLFCSCRCSRSLSHVSRSHKLPAFAITVLSISQSSKDRPCLSLPQCILRFHELVPARSQEKSDQSLFLISGYIYIYTASWPLPTAPLLAYKRTPNMHLLQTST